VKIAVAWSPATVVAVLAACGEVAQPPPVLVPCVTRANPTITLSGVHTSPFTNTNLGRNSTIDAADARFVTSENIAISIGGGSGICFLGGDVMGSEPPATPYSTMHLTYGLVARASSFRVEDLRVFDYGDGASMDAQGDANWSVRDAYFKFIRDDCVENDFLNSGTIDNSLFDGCFEGFSSRPYTTTLDGSDNLVVVRNSLFRLQDMDQGYSRPGHGGFFKWDAKAPRIELYNNVYRVDSPIVENDALIPPANKLQACSGNVMIWLGAGPFPETLPPCYTLLTGDAGLEYWNRAVAAWKAGHPKTLVDAAPPIVSVDAPADSATVSSVVELTATAVDDQAVTGVQFRLNDQDVGAELQAEAPITKFTLSWDSHALPNGSYRLTAVARDAAGNATTSSGVVVTIAN